MPGRHDELSKADVLIRGCFKGIRARTGSEELSMASGQVLSVQSSTAGGTFEAARLRLALTVCHFCSCPVALQGLGRSGSELDTRRHPAYLTLCAFCFLNPAFPLRPLEAQQRHGFRAGQLRTCTKSCYADRVPIPSHGCKSFCHSCGSVGKLSPQNRTEMTQV